MGNKRGNNIFWNEGSTSEKQNLIFLRDSSPIKDEAPQLMHPWIQFNSEQPIKLPDVQPPCSFQFLHYDVKRCCDRRAELCFLLGYLCGRRCYAGLQVLFKQKHNIMILYSINTYKYMHVIWYIIPFSICFYHIYYSILIPTLIQLQTYPLCIAH